MPSHSGSVAALQDESTFPQLRVAVKALHLAFVVIRIPPPPHFATDQTATAVTVLDDVLDRLFVYLSYHHKPGPKPLVLVDELKFCSRRMNDGRDCGHTFIRER